jgi:hypothetical protein
MSCTRPAPPPTKCADADVSGGLTKAQAACWGDVHPTAPAWGALAGSPEPAAGVGAGGDQLEWHCACVWTDNWLTGTCLRYQQTLHMSCTSEQQSSTKQMETMMMHCGQTTAAAAKAAKTAAAAVAAAVARRAAVWHTFSGATQMCERHC